MITYCTKLKDFLKVQRQVINKHIERHMWFQHIPDQNTAIADFNDKYGWLMRELFCGQMCPSRKECQLAKEFLAQEEEEEKVPA